MRLELDGIEKRYGDEHALRDVDLVLEPGVVGLLGPNGAGKSTLMRIVTTVLQPTDGQVRWNGTDVREEPRAIRDSVGYLPQSFGVYPSLTAREFLCYLAAIRGVSNVGERIDDLLALVNLEAAADRRLGGFSGGMRQRVGIAQALLADPDLLVVDEPTVGLDPTERVRFRNVLAELAEDRIVVLSTHIVSDVEVTASDIVLLNDGRVLAHESPAALLDEVAGSVWEWTVGDDDLAAVKREYTISGTARRSDGVAVRVVSASRPTPAAEPAEPTLEDAYLDAIGR
ncbi:ATP-binding cassette domain-containing protein [Halomicrobium mukohataei]|uniref:ATP-binding cassette domain-containing protein n=1 Tax=Halomicrobium mukohataei TaxID=57705 RepID=A0A847UH21_9EURY|nr:ABC transporter ATP-binding protein [Halomicrobium mukohataei]NLV10814.1 ATP-binding cassette domain-containing protein [Halomicrobium mukohataei]